jgi:hypothetical protein
MNRNRIWLFAGLGVLTTCISILAAKKYRKGKNRIGSNSYEAGSSTPRYQQRVQ